MKSQDCEDCVINPAQGRGEPTLPQLGILAVNPSEAPMLAAYANEAGMQRAFLFHSNLYYSEQLFLAGPAVGAPMAVMCLEKLIALGAKQVILYGWCGSLHRGLRAKDIFLPTEALAEEGTSAHYQEDIQQTLQSTVPLPSPHLHKHLSNVLCAEGISFQAGKIWTTDAPYRETRSKVVAYAEQGISAVDMEFSALCTVAAFRGVELAGAMLVSDELWQQPWQPLFTHKAFRRRSRELLRLLATGVKVGIPTATHSPA